MMARVGDNYLTSFTALTLPIDIQPFIISSVSFHRQMVTPNITSTLVITAAQDPVLLTRFY